MHALQILYYCACSENNVVGEVKGQIAWCGGCGKVSKEMALSREDVHRFHREGYLLIEGFLTAEECEYLKTRAWDIVNQADFDKHPLVTFNTKSTAQRHTKTDYFLTSGDKVRFFFEEGALDQDGKLTMDPKLALNKMGHALHALDPDFKEITFSEKVRGVAKALNLKKPCVVQSMVIFKPPKIGGVVKPHQDSTFLHTVPMNLVGYWIALEDADLENGCMWFAPGTHKNGVVGRLKRCTGEGGVVDTVYEGEAPSTSSEEFVPVPVKKGDLVLIHGEVVHKSEANGSDRSRNIYTFHLYDANTSVWSEENWLQPSTDLPFPFLYE